LKPPIQLTRLLHRETTMLKRFVTQFVCCAAFVAAVDATASAQETLAITGAKVLTLASEPIEKGTILIRDGKIEAVGADVTIPLEAKVIDASGQVVMPGFIDSHTSEGMGQANERNENVPFLSVVDGIDPVVDYFEEARRNGITTTAILPGNNTMIGGQGVVVKTAGQYVNDMIVKRDTGVKISLRPASGSRMGHVARLRMELDKAKQVIERKKNGEAVEAKPVEPAQATPEEPKPAEGQGTEGATPPEASAAPPVDPNQGLDVLVSMLEGKLPAFIYCDTAMDVTTALSLIEEYSFKAIFVLGKDTYKAAPLLAGRDQPVILDSTLIFWETDPRTQEDKKIVLTKVFSDAKVPFVFQIENSGPGATSAASYLWYQAAIAVKHGMPEVDALKCMSLVPAKLLGIDEFVGTIEAGKDADLVILSGEPLRLSTWVNKTIVRGKIVYDRAADTKLERLLAPAAE
jgi:imidazolonepropionase-like amidohydrolase